ncbi:hypothetical protein NE237_018510 [Protea cynaroides]|uniref:Uncharacterized protein n=1 Tax=Protea cynaroides TaxID=273540 RepID=A0A9Q0KA77_9MAGN|nr:hypothetical protein NE237_018510 [Protea cynaroides]
MSQIWSLDYFMSECQGGSYLNYVPPIPIGDAPPPVAVPDGGSWVGQDGVDKARSTWADIVDSDNEGDLISSDDLASQERQLLMSLKVEATNALVAMVSGEAHGAQTVPNSGLMSTREDGQVAVVNHFELAVVDSHMHQASIPFTVVH